MAAPGQAEESLPLSEATFLILLSLAPGPKHGYAVMKDVAHLSKQRIVLSSGTLYGALKRLLEQDWIERLPGTDVDQGGRPQKVYALTELGRRMLAVETARLRSLVQAATGRVVMGEL